MNVPIGSFVVAVAIIALSGSVPTSASDVRAADTATAACGNSALDAGEECDDGNTEGGDGCSVDCQVEPGFTCSDPVAADLTNRVEDPGFEAGPEAGIWEESSVNFGTPICSEELCFFPGPRSGTFWAWFGGSALDPEEAMLAQTVIIPATASELRLWLQLPTCDSANDFFQALLDDAVLLTVTGDDALCGGVEYVERVVDIRAAADGNAHVLAFHAQTFLTNGGPTDFYLDDVLLVQGPTEPQPGLCTPVGDLIFADGFETVL